MSAAGPARSMQGFWSDWIRAGGSRAKPTDELGRGLPTAVAVPAVEPRHPPLPELCRGLRCRRIIGQECERDLGGQLLEHHRSARPVLGPSSEHTSLADVAPRRPLCYGRLHRTFSAEEVHGQPRSNSYGKSIAEVCPWETLLV